MRRELATFKGGELSFKEEWCEDLGVWCVFCVAQEMRVAWATHQDRNTARAMATETLAGRLEHTQEHMFLMVCLMQSERGTMNEFKLWRALRMHCPNWVFCFRSAMPTEDAGGTDMVVWSKKSKDRPIHVQVKSSRHGEEDFRAIHPEIVFLDIAIRDDEERIIAKLEWAARANLYTSSLL